MHFVVATNRLHAQLNKQSAYHLDPIVQLLSIDQFANQ